MCNLRQVKRKRTVYSIVHVMAESDRSSSLLDVKNDSILSGSVYSSAEVGEGDASSGASLLPLPVADIQPYCFEPEWEVDLETSTSSEAEEMLGNDSQEHLGNIIWYLNISGVTKFCSVCTSETFLYWLGACVVIANQCQRQESVFAAKKSTKSKHCWLMNLLQSVSHNTQNFLVCACVGQFWP